MNKGRILKKCDAILFSMPSLEEDKMPESKEMLLQNAEEIQRKAYQEGFESGEKAGFAEGKQRAIILIERLEKIIDEIITFKNDLVRNLELQVIDLSLAIAKKVVIEEVNAKPEIMITMVKAALKKLQRTGTITIKVNPTVYDLFIENKSRLIDIHHDIVLDVDTNIPVIGPLVISQTEEVITDVDALLNNVAKEMNQEYIAQGTKHRIENKENETILQVGDLMTDDSVNNDHD